jgi:hypothetical protein
MRRGAIRGRERKGCLHAVEYVLGLQRPSTRNWELSQTLDDGICALPSHNPGARVEPAVQRSARGATTDGRRAAVRRALKAMAVCRSNRLSGVEAQCAQKTASCRTVYSVALFQFLAIDFWFVETPGSADHDGREPTQCKDRDDDVPKGIEMVIQRPNHIPSQALKLRLVAWQPRCFITV